MSHQYYRITIVGQKYELQDFCRAYGQAFTCIGVRSFTNETVTFDAITGEDFAHAYSPGSPGFALLEGSLRNDERVTSWGPLTDKEAGFVA